ncbi:universal stress protein [Streptomyces oryzae]|uniref:Universal stress protein n=1 Tax=Streptomyces oryzae TaxID=1434886 RepID=A0ABS3X560_9ACTN|nr:universal stress protein [Streptomyces oryzae]MBO8190510.1 universal stress protein [Streptomyces oryzae]
MERPVVVGVDGSESGLEAVDWAADEAVLRGVPLRVLHASLWQRFEHCESPSPQADSGQSPERILAERILAAAQQRAARRQPDAHVTAEIQGSDPVEMLLRAGESAAMVVTGARGREPVREMLLGSVALGTAGRATCPTVVVRGGVRTFGGSGTVVLGVSARSQGTAAVSFAVEEAEARGWDLECVHALGRREGSDPEGVTARARAGESLDALALPVPARVNVRTAVLEGTPWHVLLDVARDAGLLVVGARRRQGIFGLELGLANHAALMRAPCPVAVVPEPMTA